MNQLTVEQTLSRERREQLEEDTLKLFEWYKNREQEEFCNFVVTPNNIGPIVKEALFKGSPFQHYTVRKDGSFRKVHYEPNLLTIATTYNIFSEQTVEELFAKVAPVQPTPRSLPLFSEHFIYQESHHCYDKVEEIATKARLYYSEVLKELQPSATPLYDWDILARTYANQVKELNLYQKLANIPGYK